MNLNLMLDGFSGFADVLAVVLNLNIFSFKVTTLKILWKCFKFIAQIQSSSGTTHSV